MSISKHRIDALLDEFQELGDLMRNAKERRAQIARTFPQGRTEGTRLAIYRERDTVSRGVLNYEMLKRYVTKEVLDLCRTTRMRSGTTKLVPLLKGRKKKKV